jgi:hypothetical protein
VLALEDRDYHVNRLNFVIKFSVSEGMVDYNTIAEGMTHPHN